MQSRFALIAGSIICGLAVVIGAFGAHALQPTLVETDRLGTFETAVQYQFFHGLALIGVGIVSTLFPSRFWIIVIAAFMLGIVFFSGSLYLVSLSDNGTFGMVAPIGGFFLIAGWFAMAWAVAKSKKNPSH